MKQESRPIQVLADQTSEYREVKIISKFWAWTLDPANLTSTHIKWHASSLSLATRTPRPIFDVAEWRARAHDGLYQPRHQRSSEILVSSSHRVSSYPHHLKPFCPGAQDPQREWRKKAGLTPLPLWAKRQAEIVLFGQGGSSRAMLSATLVGTHHQRHCLLAVRPLVGCLHIRPATAV